MKAVFHDLKTERTNVGQPLPKALMLLPLFFYTTMLGAIAFSTFAFYKVKQFQKEEQNARIDEQSKQTEIAQVDESSAGIELEVKNAREVQAWMQSTNQLQPIVLGVARAMDPESTITSLTLARREEMPSQITMVLGMNAPRGAAQVDALLTQISETLGYRSFSESVTNKGSKTDLNLECTWIKTEHGNTLDSQK